MKVVALARNRPNFGRYSQNQLKIMKKRIGNLKFYFLYDFGDKWIFQIRKSRKRIKAETNVKYPRIIERIGDDPLSHLYNE